MNPVFIAVSALALLGVLLALYRYFKRLNGIHGGLTLIVLGLLIANPLYRLDSINWLQNMAGRHPDVANSPYWDICYTAAIFLTALSIAVGIYGGMILATGKARSTVVRSTMAIWLAVPVVNTLYLLIAGEVAELTSSAAPGFVAGTLPALGLAVVATAYLFTSRQVRDTYIELPPAEGSSLN